ncbi:MAG: 4Fe-4S binding protein [Clostridiales bacterium]|nr:4Fe-4S binding protein [Clostridiales bacterium]
MIRITNSAQTKNDGKRLVIIKERCSETHICRSVKACPAGALSQNGYLAPEADYKNCIACGKCVKLCPKKVFVLK